MPYNQKLLLKHGIEVIEQGLKRTGFEIVDSAGNEILIKHDNKTVTITVEKTKITAKKVGSSLQDFEMFLKEANKLDLFIVKLPEVFDNDEEEDPYFNAVEAFTDSNINNILNTGENVYLYNGTSFEWFNNKSANDYFSNLYEDTFSGKFAIDTKVSQASKYFFRKSSASREFNFKSSTKNKIEKVCLGFKDGTLYIKKDRKLKFKLNHWSLDDNLFFNFNLNFEDIKESNGMIEEWFNTKFEDNDKIVVKALFADIFITSNDSQVMLYLYGKAGTGKSLLQNTIVNMIGSDKVSGLSLDEMIGDKFKRKHLATKVVNVSSEVSKRTLDSSQLKTIISRDLMTFELKGFDSTMGYPLAKQFGVGNDLPRGDVDEAVLRRFKPIRLKDDYITEFKGNVVDKTEFNFLFQNDHEGFLNIILDGIELLFNYNFDCDFIYNEFASEEYVRDFKTINDAVQDFLMTYTEFSSEENKGIELKTLFEAFEYFRTTTEGTGVSQMKFRTFCNKVESCGLDKIRKTAGKGKTPLFYKNIKFTDEFIRLLIVEKRNSFPIFDVETYKKALIPTDKPSEPPITKEADDLYNEFMAKTNKEQEVINYFTDPEELIPEDSNVEFPF
ncbi:DUF5906 domain-containing protein [Cetobacterium sp.]|uniref:DUF5906 domain-containing protein n=1 Tax=Cetobacterium sp. TaxID=2071632 RepID=UPI003F2D6C08